MNKIRHLAILFLLVLLSIELKAQTYEHADRYYEQANELFKAKKYEESALTCLNGIESELECLPPRKERLSLLYFSAAYCYDQLEQYDFALQYYQHALAYDTDLGDGVNTAVTHKNIGHCYEMLNMIDSAIGSYDSALHLDQQMHDEQVISDDWFKIGSLYKMKPDYEKACAYLIQALTIRKRIGDDYTIAYLLAEIGYCYSKLKQFEKSVEYYIHSLEYNRRTNDQEMIALDYMNIGMTYYFWKKYEIAIEYYSKSLSIYESRGEPMQVSSIKLLVGKANHDWGRYRKALECYNHALDFEKKQGNNFGIGTALTHIGLAYNALGKYDAALDNLNQSLQIKQSMHSPREVAAVLNSIGLVHESSGNFIKALESYQKALELNNEMGLEEEIATNFNNIAGIYKASGAYDKACTYYKQAYNIDSIIRNTTEMAIVSNNIGVLFEETGHYEKAISYYAKSDSLNRQLEDPVRKAKNLFDTGKAYINFGKFQAAVPYLLESAELYNKHDKPERVAENYQLIGTAYSGLEQPDSALYYHNESSTLLTYLMRFTDEKNIPSLHAQQIRSYEDQVIIYLRTNQVAEAVKTMESKIRVERQKSFLNDRQRPAPYPGLRLVMDSLRPDQAIVMLGQIDRFETAMMAITRDTMLGATDARKLLIRSLLTTIPVDEREKLLNRIGRHDYNYFQRSQERIFDEAAEQNEYRILCHIFAYYREQIASPESNHNKLGDIIGQQLFHYFLFPFEEIIKDKKELIFINNGILSSLPMDVLKQGNNRYLIEQYDISYLKSLSDLVRAPEKRWSPERNVLAIGAAPYDQDQYVHDNQYAENPRNPLSEYAITRRNTRIGLNEAELADMSDKIGEIVNHAASLSEVYDQLGITNWNNLPGSWQEISEIKSTVENTMLLIGPLVNEEHIKSMSRNYQLNARVLHLAIHGLVFGDLPMASALIFPTPPDSIKEDDGILHINEIQGLRIQSELVALSGLETTLGNVLIGTGIHEMTEAFDRAGSGGLLFSNWQVPDRSTSAFFKEFYQGVFIQKQSYAASLSQTKRKFLNGEINYAWQSPYFWSTFMYYGK